MDHLQIPQHYKVKAMTVPYLGAAKYDGEGFDGYLEERSLTPFILLSMLKEDRGALPQPFDMLQGGVTRLLGQSILQEWLYFSVLHEFAQACG